MRRGRGASCSQSPVGRAPVERYGFAWNSIAQAALLPYRRRRSETGVGRAAPGACSSSGARAWSAPLKTPASEGERARSAARGST